jgi:hypothetical protein
MGLNKRIDWIHFLIFAFETNSFILPFSFSRARKMREKTFFLLWISYMDSWVNTEGIIRGRGGKMFWFLRTFARKPLTVNFLALKEEIVVFLFSRGRKYGRGGWEAISHFHFIFFQRIWHGEDCRLDSAGRRKDENSHQSTFMCSRVAVVFTRRAVSRVTGLG